MVLYTILVFHLYSSFHELYRLDKSLPLYLYNDISIHSAHHNNSTKNDYKYIYDYKHLFTNLTDEDKLTTHWKLLNLPFNYIDPPYPIDFDKYTNAIKEVVSGKLVSKIHNPIFLAIS